VGRCRHNEESSDQLKSSIFRPLFVIVELLMLRSGQAADAVTRAEK
jgi:hypothetical protein